MKLVVWICLALMAIGAALGYAIWRTPAASIGFSLVGLGATIASMWLLGAEPDQPEGE